jgi:hypothetical protein
LGIFIPSEEMMGRKFIDRRAFSSEMNCTIAISADTVRSSKPWQASRYSRPAADDRDLNEGRRAANRAIAPELVLLRDIYAG